MTYFPAKVTTFEFGTFFVEVIVGYVVIQKIALFNIKFDKIFSRNKRRTGNLSVNPFIVRNSTKYRKFGIPTVRMVDA